MPDLTQNMPETVTTTEATTAGLEPGVEATPIAEIITPDPAAPVSQVADDSLQTAAVATSELVTDATISQDEVEDLSNDGIEKADQNWVGKVQQVIRDDSGQPYKEEEDAEALNEAYMKDRFNVDVDGPVEEK